MPDETSTTGETSGGPVTTTAPPMGVMWYASTGTTDTWPTGWTQLGMTTDHAPTIGASSTTTLYVTAETVRSAQEVTNRLGRIMPTVRQDTYERYRIDYERRRADYDEYISREADRAAESERHRQSASERAKELLFRYLDPVNQHRYEHFGYIEFEGSDGRTYRLRTAGYTGNITIIENGERVSRWCAHGPPFDPQGRSIPMADMILTQMIALQTDAAAVMAIANQY